jgi:hypothetical protein
MKFDLIHLLMLVVVGYVIYQYVLRENMSSIGATTTEILMVVGVIVVLGGLAMYATSK